MKKESSHGESCVKCSPNTTLHVTRNIERGPWGGGNQFLQGLIHELSSTGNYQTDAREADLLLVNSFHIDDWNQIFQACIEKLRRPEVRILHRVDGPYSIVRGRRQAEDWGVRLVNACVADGTVFQSRWSMQENVSMGMRLEKPYVQILNAPKDTFRREVSVRKAAATPPIKVICWGWSTNPNKGFSDLAWLDKNLDPSRFHVTYVGNTPISFENFEHLPPVDSDSLAQLAADSDIFLFPARNEPCSNALTEALSAGLPAVVFDGGGNPEILRGGGELYSDVRQVPGLLGKVGANLNHYASRIFVSEISEVAGRYLEFGRELTQRSDLGHKFQSLRLIFLIAAVGNPVSNFIIRTAAKFRDFARKHSL